MTYDALDWLLRCHLAGATLLLYDISSSYLTGRHCPLGLIGYSRLPARRAGLRR